MKKSTNGAIFPPLGKWTQPGEIAFEKGKIVDFRGHSEALQWKEWLVSQEDPKIFCIAHVSIGLKPNAPLRGFITKDERVKGSVTFGKDMKHSSCPCILGMRFLLLLGPEESG